MRARRSTRSGATERDLSVVDMLGVGLRKIGIKWRWLVGFVLVSDSFSLKSVLNAGENSTEDEWGRGGIYE